MRCGWMALAVQYADSAQMQSADRRFDFAEITDDDPGHRIRIDDALDGALHAGLINGFQMRFECLYVVVWAFVLDNAFDRIQNCIGGFITARQATDELMLDLVDFCLSEGACCRSRPVLPSVSRRWMRPFCRFVPGPGIGKDVGLVR